MHWLPSTTNTHCRNSRNDGGGSVGWVRSFEVGERVYVKKRKTAEGSQKQRRWVNAVPASSAPSGDDECVRIWE